MKSIERAHIVVVAGGERGEALVAQLRRMQVRQVTTVSDVEGARRLCVQGDASLCLVAYVDTVLDAVQPVTYIASGRDSGTPSLMLIDAVTPLFASDCPSRRLQGRRIGENRAANALSAHWGRLAGPPRRFAPAANASAQDRPANVPRIR
jgi:hypothetical protein